MSGQRNYIFFGGIPRSGTTIAAYEVSRKIPVMVVPESQFREVLIAQEKSNEPYSLSSRTNMKFKTWGLKRYKNSSTNLSARQAFDHIVENLCDRKNVPYHDVCLDHTPSNVYNAKRDIDVFGVCMYINVIRDPISVISSLMSTDWGLTTIQKAVEFWRRQHDRNQFGVDYLTSSTRTTFEEIKYEDLCYSQNVSSLLSRKITKLINSSSEQRTSSTIFLPSYTVGQHSRVLEPPTLTTKDKNVFSERELQYIHKNIREYRIYHEYYGDSCANSKDLKKNQQMFMNANHPGLKDYARLALLPRARILNIIRRQRSEVIVINRTVS